MSKIEIKTKEGKVRLSYDINCDQYLLQKINKKQVFESIQNMSRESLCDFLKQNCDSKTEPLKAVLIKAIKGGYDPSTLRGVREVS